MGIPRSYLSFDVLSSAVKENRIILAKEILESYNFSSNNNWEDYTLLLLALERGHLRMIDLLLNKGCRVRRNMRTNQFYTPLYYAVTLKDINIVRRLLIKGASVTDRDLNEETPLCLAIRKQEFEMVDLMLSMYNFDNINIFNYYCVIHFYMACVRNKFNVVRNFVERGIPVNGYQTLLYLDPNGYSPLHFAVKYMNPEIVDLLLKKGANILAINLFGQTALHLAYGMSREYNEKHKYKEEGKLNRIIDSILLVNTTVCVNPIDTAGISHFHIACARGKSYVVEHFIKCGVNVNATTLPNIKWCPSYTGGHLAIENNCLEVVRLLLWYGADFYKTTSIGDTFLHLAVDYEHLKIVQELMKYDANINILNHEGNTPLHIAFSKKNDLIMDLLLTYCSKIINSRNNTGISHFHIACSRNSVHTVQRFLENDISVDQYVNLNDHCHSGYSPLHFAVDYNRLSIVEVLLQYNANVNAKDDKGLTPLHLACIQNYLKFKDIVLKFVKKSYHEQGCTINWTSERKDHIKIIKLLLEHEANVNSINNIGLTPLFYACSVEMPYFVIPNKFLDYDIGSVLEQILKNEMLERRNEIINILVENGADLKVRISRKETILHSLLRQPLNNSTVELLSLFVNRGAEVNAADIDNETPLLLAVKHASTEETNVFPNDGQISQYKIIEILLQKGANPNCIGTDGMTPLHNCSSLFYVGMEPIFKLLINASGDINARDSHGRTPLHIAAFQNKFVAVRICLRNGADINILDNFGQNALFYIGAQNDDFNILNHFSYNEVFKLIHNHIYKLKKLGFYIRDSLDKQLQMTMLYNQNNDTENRYNHNDVELLSSQCQSEIERLKNIKINHSISLYNLLFKSFHEISNYANNETFQTIVQSPDLEQQYPQYGYLLKLKFKYNLMRNKLLKCAKIPMEFFITQIGLPEECLDEILKHLDNHSLLKLKNDNSMFLDIYC